MSTADAEPAEPAEPAKFAEGVEGAEVAETAEPVEVPWLLQLPDELITYIFQWLDPRTIKWLGLMCRRLYELAQRFIRTAAYTAMLARSMLTHCAKCMIEVNHDRHCRPDRCLCRIDAITQRTESQLIVGLTGHKGLSFAGWVRVDYLRLLYPGATQLYDWPLASHALEWCARHERDILGTGGEPRHEILAVFHRDVFARLLDLSRNFAAQNEMFKQTVQSVLMRDVKFTDEWYVSVRREVFLAAAGSDDCVAFAIVVVMAVTSAALCGGAHDSLFKQSVMCELSKLPPVYDESFRNKFSETDNAWLALAGFVESRNVRHLINNFKCEKCLPSV
jgi:hypothetical protein